MARAFVRIAGAERHPFRHLAPSAGVWGLAPTLPNTTEHRSVAGSVPTGSRAHLPFVISRLPGSLNIWASPASTVRLGPVRRENFAGGKVGHSGPRGAAAGYVAHMDVRDAVYFLGTWILGAVLLLAAWEKLKARRAEKRVLQRESWSVRRALRRMKKRRRDE